MNLRILVVEDQPETAELIRWFLVNAGYSQVSIVNSARMASARLARAVFDLVVLDLGLPDGDGTWLIPKIRTIAANTRIIVVTAATAGERVVLATRLGANGYIFKDELDVSLPAAIQTALGGGAPFSQGAIEEIVSTIRLDTSELPVVETRLTAREMDVIQCLPACDSYDGIADVLDRSIETIRSHLKQVYTKLDVHNGWQAIYRAMRLGLVHTALTQKRVIAARRRSVGQASSRRLLKRRRAD